MARTKHQAQRQADKGGKSSKKAVKKALKQRASEQKPKEAEIKVRKPHRWRPGTEALRDIKRCQKSTGLLLRKLPFQRLVREIAQEYKSDLRFQGTALEVLQQAAESFVVDTFKDGYAIDLYADNVTIQPAAMRLAMALNPLRAPLVPSAPLSAPIGRLGRLREDIVQQALAGHSMGAAVSADPAPRKAPAKRKPLKPKKNKAAPAPEPVQEEAPAPEPLPAPVAEPEPLPPVPPAVEEEPLPPIAPAEPLPPKPKKQRLPKPLSVLDAPMVAVN